MRFHVLDNYKPAKYPNHQIDPSWKENAYSTFEEAEKYLRHYLGIYAPSNDHKFTLGIAYDYSGYGDSIIIVQDK